MVLASLGRCQSHCQSLPHSRLAPISPPRHQMQRLVSGWIGVASVRCTNSTGRREPLSTAPRSTTPAGSWTGSAAPTRRSSRVGMPTRLPPRPVPQGHQPRPRPGPAARARLPALRRRRPIRPQGRPAPSPTVPRQPLAPRHRTHTTHTTSPADRFCGLCGFCGAWRHPWQPPMKGRAAVTLSNENGPSRSRPYRESDPGVSRRQRSACVPRRPSSPNAVRHYGAGRP